jgi:hypothetical protein
MGYLENNQNEIWYPTQGMDVCMCVYAVSVLSCVHAAALRRADHSSKGSYRLRKKDYVTEEEARARL